MTTEVELGMDVDLITSEELRKSDLLKSDDVGDTEALEVVLTDKISLINVLSHDMLRRNTKVLHSYR